MRRESWTVSDLHLEQYVLGELPAAESQRVREALQADEKLRARLAEIERSNQEILSMYPPQRVAPGIRERLGEGRARERRRRSYLPYILPAAAAALVLISFFTLRDAMLPFLARAAGAEVTRVKGGNPHLTIFKKTSGGAEELVDGSAVHPKDVLQIGYVGGEARYGVIFSVDGRGVLTYHLPGNYKGQSLNSPELERQGQAVLPFAYELDDAPGFERFFFVYARSPFDVQKIAQAARALASKPRTADTESLRLPSGVSMFSMTLRKQG